MLKNDIGENKSENKGENKGENKSKSKKNYKIVKTIEGKNAIIFENKEYAPIVPFEDMIKIDKRTPEMYQKYYEFLMPFYKEWYDRNEYGGYRPVVKATNLVANIEKNNVRRKCWCPTCLVPGHEEEKGLTKTVFNPLPNTRLGCWRCELIGDIPKEYVIEVENWKEEDIKKLKPHVPRDPMASAFDRYVTYKSKLLYNIEMFEKVPTMFRGVRTMYWQPCIRSEKLKNVATDNSFGQIVGLNPVIDIDVLSKHTKTVFDYWDENWKMLNDVSKVLDDNDVEYKNMFSGNGWYFILKKMTLKDDNMDNLVNEQFWNIVTEGTKTWLTENVKVIQDKYHFDIQVGNMNPMKFVKSPFSIHQRLETVAVPLSLDMFNNFEMNEFLEFVNPENIKDTFKECENVFGGGMKDLISW